jgi:hypothetical protein
VIANVRTTSENWDGSKVFLKPLVESKRLQLWADTDIRIGDEWHPEIIRAIERSSVALLLISADFLASDFIMKQELPVLISRRVRLVSREP